MAAESNGLSLFSLEGKRALVTGGAGDLCCVICRGIARAGAEVILADVRADAAESAAATLRGEGLKAQALQLDVLDPDSLARAADQTASLGGLDILVNGAGGNQKAATTSPDVSFFDLPSDALKRVVDLNLFGGAILPSQRFGKLMAQSPKGGVILNISSVTAFRPMTRVAGYSAAKAAVNNFTQWLAVHLAQEYGPKIRVNALAPGFFLTEQNRHLLTDEATGNLTPRGKSVIAHTPMARLGDPEDLVGTVVWLCSDAARFVTGIVVPVDGGFSAYSGV